jgi:hypothetical protein
VSVVVRLVRPIASISSSTPSTRVEDRPPVQQSRNAGPNARIGLSAAHEANAAP